MLQTWQCQTHEPANCATAHYQCNSAKGDRDAGEQLALIG